MKDLEDKCIVEHIESRNRYTIEKIDGDFVGLRSIDKTTEGHVHISCIKYYQVVICRHKCNKDKCVFNKD